MAADVIYTAPTSEPLTIDEAREHLKVDISTDDMLISSLIIAAREYYEKFQRPPRVLMTQTREKYLESWPAENYIELTSPLVSVTSVSYYGTDDTPYTIESGDYYVDTKSFVGRVGLAYGKSWPTTTLRPFNGICIRYVCGAAAADEMIKAGLKLLIGHLYENREAGTERALQEIPFGVKTLLGMDRVPI